MPHPPEHGTPVRRGKKANSENRPVDIGTSGIPGRGAESIYSYTHTHTHTQRADLPNVWSKFAALIEEIPLPKLCGRARAEEHS